MCACTESRPTLAAWCHGFAIYYDNMVIVLLLLLSVLLPASRAAAQRCSNLQPAADPRVDLMNHSCLDNLVCFSAEWSFIFGNRKPPPFFGSSCIKSRCLFPSCVSICECKCASPQTGTAVLRREVAWGRPTGFCMNEASSFFFYLPLLWPECLFPLALLCSFILSDYDHVILNKQSPSTGRNR